MFLQLLILKKKNPDNQKQLKLEFKKIQEERNFCSDNFCQRKSPCPNQSEHLEMDIHFSENGKLLLKQFTATSSDEIDKNNNDDDDDNDQNNTLIYEGYVTFTFSVF